MRNTILGILLLASGILSFSCQKTFEEHEVGQDLISSNSSVSVTDTVFVKSSTVKLDSMISSSTSLLGSYHDKFLGNIKSDSYFRLKPSSSFLLSEADKPVLDSVVVIFKPESYYYGDTLVKQSFKVFVVEEEMKPLDLEKPVFYNNQTFKHSSYVLASTNNVSIQPIGSKTDKQKNRIRISVSGDKSIAYVNTIFAEALKPKNRINAPSTWSELSHGLCITSGDNDACMIAMAPKSFRLRFYFHDKSSTAVTKQQVSEDKTGYLELGAHKTFDFILNNKVQFSKLNANTSNTPLDKLDSQSKTLETVTEYKGLNDLSFIQSAVGLVTKIDLSSFLKIKDLGIGQSLLKAELIFYPISSTVDEYKRPLPGSFILYRTDSENKKIAELFNSNRKVLESSFVSSEKSDEDSYFSFDITAYTNNVLTSTTDTKALLFIAPKNINTSFNRMILSNTKSSKRRIKLKLTYVVHE